MEPQLSAFTNHPIIKALIKKLGRLSTVHRSKVILNYATKSHNDFHYNELSSLKQQHGTFFHLLAHCWSVALILVQLSSSELTRILFAKRTKPYNTETIMSPLFNQLVIEDHGQYPLDTVQSFVRFLSTFVPLVQKQHSRSQIGITDTGY